MYTDHRNVTCNVLNTGIELIWVLILEEYGTDIEYIKVEKT